MWRIEATRIPRRLMSYAIVAIRSIKCPENTGRLKYHHLQGDP
jgi:hypothetical protein